jgi:hypothetical protein
VRQATIEGNGDTWAGLGNILDRMPCEMWRNLKDFGSRLGDGDLEAWGDASWQAGLILLPAAKAAQVAEAGEAAGVVRALQSGGEGGGLLADEAYNAIRASTTDIAEIAESTGFKPSNIEKIKNHLFNDEHILDRHLDPGEIARVARFDSDSEIAEAWQRLRQGTHLSEDISLLKHEMAEINRMRKWGQGYNRAHTAAQQRFPWNPPNPPLP